MASLAWTVPMSQVVVLSSAKKAEKKGLFDWLGDAFEKDQLSETDPVLQKVEGKNGAANKAPAGKKAAPAPPQKKGGFFGKK